MNKTLSTIKLQGKDYCQVKDRIKGFNENYEKGAIQTTSQFVGDTVIFKATIYPNIVAEPTRFFTASSFGKIAGIKAFEKLESVAVGRCLAYLGFGIDGSIASYEEMQNFVENQEIAVETANITVSKPVNNQEKPKFNDNKIETWLSSEQYQELKTAKENLATKTPEEYIEYINHDVEVKKISNAKLLLELKKYALEQATKAGYTMNSNRTAFTKPFDDKDLQTPLQPVVKSKNEQVTAQQLKLINILCSQHENRNRKEQIKRDYQVQSTLTLTKTQGIEIINTLNSELKAKSS
jgi:hypothetical protein